MWDKNIISSDILFYGEKTLLILKGEPPRLENIGFVYPIGYILLNTLFLNNLIVLNSFIGSLLVIVLYRFFEDRSFCIFFLFTSLPFLYILSLEPNYLISYILLAFSLYYFMKYKDTYITYYLFLGAFVLGMDFYFDFNALLFGFFESFVLTLNILLKRDYHKALTVLVVSIFPLIFFFLSYSYLNFIFKGDPIFFMKNYITLFGNVFSYNLSLIFLIKFCFKLILFSLIYALLFKKDIFYVLALAYPFFVIYIHLYNGSVAQISILFILVALVFNKDKVFSTKLIFSLVLIQILTNFLFLYSKDPIYENSFYDKIRYYKEASSIVKTLNGKILTDDRFTYPVVFFYSNPKKFILPYQIYFNFALVNNDLFNYIILSKNDSLYYYFKNKNFKTVYENNELIIKGWSL